MYIKKLCFVNTHRVVRYGTVIFANDLQKPIFLKQATLYNSFKKRYGGRY